MDGETIALLVGCIATVVGALAFVSRSQARAAEKHSAAQNALVRELAVAHASNIETRLGQLVAASHETIIAVRENTAAVNLLVSRFDAPPPTGGVVSPTSEDETPPLGIVRPTTSVTYFKRRGIKDK